MKVRLAPLAAALTLALASGASHAGASQDTLLAELKRLAERMEKLEKRNAELERRLAAQPTPALAQRVDALEDANRQVRAGLESDRITEKEPELVTRLKALEAKTDSHGPAAKLAEALEGISVEGSVAAVAQRVNGKARADRKDETALTWRGDVGITLPGGDIGAGKGEFFAHLRMGQGSGIEGLRPTFTGATNSLAFQQEGEPSENTTAIVAQAWYQLTTPLGDGGEDAPHSLQITVGKIDPFVFFDQNAAADNEAEKFLNNVFVHNPMLDSGGAVGADSYGFSPGVRLAYRNESGKPEWWQASIGVFGAGDGATFGKSFTKPFVIGQLETGLRLNGLNGTYRLYGWHNGQYEGYDGATGRTAGWGISADQQVDEDLTLFARYGHASSGKVAFNRAVTLGGELNGSPWGRGADGVGLALAWLRASPGFKAAAADLPDLGYGARGAEKVAELYYRYHVNDQLSLTPDLQVIKKAGADPDANTVTALGIRAVYAF